MRAACALRIISGRIILNFAIPENLRIFRNSFFTGKAAAAHGICCFCFLRKQLHGGRNAFCGSDPIPVKMKIGNIRRCSRFSHYQYNFR